MWLERQMWPLGVLAAILAAGVLLLWLSAAVHRLRLRRRRRSITPESFTRRLEQFGFDPVIASVTYRYLQQMQGVAFPLLPGDKLDEDLGLGSEELEQTLADLAEALHRELSPGQNPAPPATVEDLIRVLQASPRVPRSSAA
jgi:hypothetical protein